MKQFLVAALLTFSIVGMAHADNRLIVVNGLAEKSLDPNMVDLNISVWSKASTAKQAQRLAAQTFATAKKTFDSFKVKKEDIQTLGYQLAPNYEFDSKINKNRLVGYQVTQTLNVTLRKVDETGNFLDALIVESKSNDSGVNVSSLSWDSDKREQATATVLGDAVRAARSKADEIAKAANVKIRNVYKISHTTSDYGGPQPIIRNFAAKAMADSAPTSVEAGQVTVRVEVSAEYEVQ